MSDKWKLILDKSYSPYMNMAIDELLLEEASMLNMPILRFYDWNVKSLSIGYIQKYEGTHKDGYVTVRRPTGGGVVFHDVDMTYTVVIPKDHEILKLDRTQSYHVFHKAIIEALDDLGILTTLTDQECKTKDRSVSQCFTAPTKYDVVSNLSDGSLAKIAGAAQRRTKDGILHQGSIVIDNIDKLQDELIRRIMVSFQKHFDIEYERYELSDEFLNKSEKLVTEKYATEEWNKIR